MKELLDSGADKEAKDNSGYTPLLWTSKNGKAEVVKLLLEYGANINGCVK